MIYRRHGIIAGLISSLFIYMAGLLRDVRVTIRERIAEPILAFIRASPTASSLAILPSFKAIAYRVINALKPEYRESYETNGASLTSNRA